MEQNSSNLFHRNKTINGVESLNPSTIEVPVNGNSESDLQLPMPLPRNPTDSTSVTVNRATLQYPPFDSRAVSTNSSDLLNDDDEHDEMGAFAAPITRLGERRVSAVRFDFTSNSSGHCNQQLATPATFAGSSSSPFHRNNAIQNNSDLLDDQDRPQVVPDFSKIQPMRLGERKVSAALRSEANRIGTVPRNRPSSIASPSPGTGSLRGSINSDNGKSLSSFSSDLVDDNDLPDFSQLKPPQLGERTVTTALRLEGHGFKLSKSHNNSFPVRSIQRGTDPWYELLKPFVADIVFRSIEYRRFQSEISFRPYTCHAAILFVDLSNYSKITAAIAHKGAHAISNVVNAYLTRILSIVQTNGGDVVKFAGDAVLVVWEGDERELDLNVLNAANCAVELQKKCGEHKVEDTELMFRIHCGLSCGFLESEIFQASTHVNMQRLYHSVGGESLDEISELVDRAKAGETCVSESCVNFLGSRGLYGEKYDDGASILKDLTLGSGDQMFLQEHINQNQLLRSLRRNEKIEEEFIHPRVLKYLSHGGLSPTHISQIRSLCVLFIAMTSNGISVNWLMEVQCILDDHRCPIVQIIDDDKGVHIVAAIGLYESALFPSSVGISVCKTLVNKQVGCAVGMASGSTFCGVTGCSSVACRWDITGPPAVRAARLMQFALKEEFETAIDESVFDDPLAATQMKVLATPVYLKGSPTGLTVYTFTDSFQFSAFGILETGYGRAHDPFVKQIKDHISDNSSGFSNRCAVVVTGIPLAGKKAVCQRAAGEMNLVPYLHVCSKANGFLQLARTIATWFKYAESRDINSISQSVLDNLDKQNWSRAHDDCIYLVNMGLSDGLQPCFLIDRIQFLDDFSLSLMRECLQMKSRYRRGASLVDASSIEILPSRLNKLDLSGEDDSDFETVKSAEVPSEDFTQKDLISRESMSRGSKGSICFLCVHVALYNEKTASNIVEDLTRGNRYLSIPLIQVGEASREELCTLFSDTVDLELEDSIVSVLAESSRYCAGYFMERVDSLKMVAGKNATGGELGYELTDDMKVQHSEESLRHLKKLPLTATRPEISMRFSLIFDELPPLFQTLLKVLSIATRTGLFKLYKSVLWEVLNDLMASGVEIGDYSVSLHEMYDMRLLKEEEENCHDVISFQCPALGDIAFDVSTPVQVNCIVNSLLERLEPYQDENFTVYLVMADLHRQINRQDHTVTKFLRQGYFAMTNLSRQEQWPQAKLQRWKCVLREEIISFGYDVGEVVCTEEDAAILPKKTLSKRLSKQLFQLKSHNPPVALGPLAHTIAVICRCIFHEIGFFHGYSRKRVEKNWQDLQSATKRYLQQSRKIELMLAGCGFASSSQDDRDLEKSLIGKLTVQAVTEVDVEKKSVLFLEQIINVHVTGRLQRLHTFVAQVRGDFIPGLILKSNAAMERAYIAMHRAKSPADSAQDALMVLASLNWTPKHVPEDLPATKYITVARLRNIVFPSKIHEREASYSLEGCVPELEAFLLLSALLDEEN